MKKINNKYLKKKYLISQILIKYFSVKSGNDNKNINYEINNLINKLKNSGLTLNTKS
jgi:hypothetical protein